MPGADRPSRPGRPARRTPLSRARTRAGLRRRSESPGREGGVGDRFAVRTGLAQREPKRAPSCVDSMPPTNSPIVLHRSWSCFSCSVHVSSPPSPCWRPHPSSWWRAAPATRPPPPRTTATPVSRPARRPRARRPVPPRAPPPAGPPRTARPPPVLPPERPRVSRPVRRAVLRAVVARTAVPVAVVAVVAPVAADSRGRAARRRAGRRARRPRRRRRRPRKADGTYTAGRAHPVTGCALPAVCAPVQSSQCRQPMLMSRIRRLASRVTRRRSSAGRSRASRNSEAVTSI